MSEDAYEWKHIRCSKDAGGESYLKTVLRAGGWELFERKGDQVTLRRLKPGAEIHAAPPPINVPTPPVEASAEEGPYKHQYFPYDRDAGGETELLGLQWEGWELLSKDPEGKRALLRRRNPDHVAPPKIPVARRVGEALERLPDWSTPATPEAERVTPLWCQTLFWVMVVVSSWAGVVTQRPIPHMRGEAEFVFTAITVVGALFSAWVWYFVTVWFARRWPLLTLIVASICVSLAVVAIAAKWDQGLVSNQPLQRWR